MENRILKQIRNSKIFLNKNEKDEEEITLKKIDELGQIIKFDNTYYSKSMLKHLTKGCTGFKCQGSKAGQFLYKAFNRSQILFTEKSWSNDKSNGYV